MIEPCTIEQLEESRAKLRIEAIAVGRTLEARKADGSKMLTLRGLETAHRMAWSRFYAVDARLRRAKSGGFPNVG